MKSTHLILGKMVSNRGGYFIRVFRSTCFTLPIEPAEADLYDDLIFHIEKSGLIDRFDCIRHLILSLSSFSIKQKVLNVVWSFSGY